MTSTAPKSGRDRRVAPRFPLGEVKASLVMDGRSISVSASNISDTGIFIATDEANLAFRTRVKIRFKNGLEITGDIVHTVDRTLATQMGHPAGYGIHLVNPPTNLAERIQSIDEQKAKVVLPKAARMAALVVDDDQQVGRAIVRALATVGFAAAHELSAKSALDRIELNHGQLNLVIIDALLPDMSGTELITKLRQTSPDVPIVAISGVLKSNSARHAVLSAGADEFLPKPFLAADICRIALDLVRRVEEERRPS